MRALIDRHLAALTFSDDSAAPLPWVSIAAILALHLLGLAAFWRIEQQPIWLALPSLALLLAIPILNQRARGAFSVETLAPLFFLYAILAVRFVFVRGFNGTVPGYFDYNLPDLRSALLRIEPWAVCAAGYALAIQARYLARRDWQRASIGAVLALTFAAFAWAGAVYIGQRTRGVSGTDPYAYAQMAVDLATRETPLHRFTLFPTVASLGISWSPIVHTGYHIPIDSIGDAPTVWPIGGAVAMALAYRLIGDEGLYLANPLASLLALAATGWLAWESFSERAIQTRAWIAALSIAIFATSHTLFDWATVPMADAQAAFFSVLAIVFALRFRRQPQLILPILCGLALGAAYFVRHTQVLIAPAILVVLWRAGRTRLRAGIAVAIAALLVALPDLWYHQVAFGGWFNVESTEQNLFSLSSAISTGGGLFDQLLAAREFGWLLPFLLFGAYRLAREKRVEFLALALWVIVLVLFHVPYPALRPRDLLPEFPPLVIVTAYGVVVFIGALWRGKRDWQQFAAACGFITVLFLLLIRVWNILPVPWSAPQPSFGYVTAAQRASFDQIAALTPPRAVIGSSLNTGPIDLYARRETFRPALWNASERDEFIAAMFRDRRAVFLLDDSAETSAARRDLESRYTLRRVAVLDVPLFGAIEGAPGALWEIKSPSQSGNQSIR
ncbi:MAG: glycosyltransferase family 39 protein [Chloroflexota bacterium]|nr:glycosyltransferase family 39 protein [Chloroflexota bacterium]